MFCPRCGQECKNEVRFCSRCGLHLNLISEITANHGLALPANKVARVGPTSLREKTMQLGTKLIFSAIALSLPFFGFCFLVDGPAPLLVPGTVFVLGLCLLFYALLSRKLEDTLSRDGVYSDRKLSPAAEKAPADNQNPVSGFELRPINTSEIPHAPAVTDHTTQFFD